MAHEYACLQLHMEAGTEKPLERILYAVTSYMDSIGMIPCGEDTATPVSYTHLHGTKTSPDAAA